MSHKDKDKNASLTLVTTKNYLSYAQLCKRMKTMHRTETTTDSLESNITWTIFKFSEINVKLQSQKISFPQGPNNIQWNLILHPYNEDKTHISIFLEVSTVNKILLKYKLTFHDGDKNELFSSKNDHTFSQNSNSNNADFLKRSDILPLKDDTLIVKCWMKIEPYANYDFFQYDHCFCNKPVLDNLNNLMTNGKFSDVILETIDGTKIAAHKCILSAQSPAFTNIFQSAITDNREEKAVKVDMDQDILKALLEYVYSNKFNKNHLKMDQLFIAAKKYEIDHLKILCEISLSQQLTVENVAEYLILADSHNSELLKTKTLHFIKTNLKDIVEKDSLKILQSNQNSLYYDIIKYLA